MWATYLHHISIHFPIVLTIGLGAVGLYYLRRPDEALRPVIRWGGWTVFGFATVAVVSGLIIAPGWFGGAGSVDLTHHRDLALTTWLVIALAAWSFERAERGGHPDWRTFAVGLWCVAAFGVIGTGHWGGAELHDDTVPWEQGEGP